MSGMVPIKRINKFFSGRDFDLEIQMGREAMEGDGNFTVILYRVDRETTQSDDIYNEASADEVNYLQPTELHVVPMIDQPENKTYNESSLRYLEDGNLTFTVYNEHLSELDVDIMVGDYVGYPINETELVYFSVTNAGEKNYNNKHTIMGYKGAYRVISCTFANKDEFNGM
mgnify:CR=1 FL=1|tara:strand:+ start:980 stop:1492 length:513 start_codon:yes stop_codon:yes gene_type:complete